MHREWVYFDADVIRREFAEIPAKDRAKLLSLMEHYRAVGVENPAPALINDLGEGIKRLRHSHPNYQGRVLYFASEQLPGLERLVVLTAYKKEGQDLPRHVLERAKSRKAQYVRKRNNDG